MIFRIQIICFFIFLNSIVQLVHAGGWPQPKGGFYIKLAEWWMVSDQHFDAVGAVQLNIVEYGYYSSSIYAEYGLAKRLTAIIYFPFINYTYTVLPSTLMKQSLWKTGDPDIGLKYALTFDKPIAISASVLLGLPLGYNEYGALQTGDNDFNQLIRLDMSGSYKLFRSDGFASFYGGYNHRSNMYADELHYGLEAGLDISKDKLSLIARIQGINAFGTSDGPFVNPQSLFSNRREYLSFSPEIAYHIDPSWGITVGAGTAFSGKNIFASPSFTVGIFYKSRPGEEQ